MYIYVKLFEDPDIVCMHVHMYIRTYNGFRMIYHSIPEIHSIYILLCRYSLQVYNICCVSYLYTSVCVRVYIRV